MNKIKTANYISTFPENLKRYKNLVSFSKIIEETLKKNIINKIEYLAIFFNLEGQENKVLDEIAWYFNIVNYRTDFSREIKINLIKTALYIHSKKGTRETVELELKNLGYDLNLEEWFEYNGKPFTYRLITHFENKDVNWIKKIINLMEENKNVRSVLEAIYLLKKKKEEICILGYKELYIATKKVNSQKDRKIEKSIYIGAYREIRKEIRI